MFFLKLEKKRERNVDRFIQKKVDVKKEKK